MCCGVQSRQPHRINVEPAQRGIAQRIVAVGEVAIGAVVFVYQLSILHEGAPHALHRSYGLPVPARIGGTLAGTIH